MVTPARYTGEKAEWLLSELAAFSTAYFDGTLNDILPDLLSRFHRRFTEVPGIERGKKELDAHDHDLLVKWISTENKVR
jgi:hypothetical protein